MLNPITPYISNRARLISFIFVLFVSFSCLVCPNEVFAGEPGNVTVSNIGSDRFTISWTTAAQESGQINYGDTSSLGSTAYDERENSFEGTTHYIIVVHLDPDITYYYDIVSGGVTYDNGGSHYTVTTGPLSSPASGSDIAHGLVFLSDGSTPAEGAIVYIMLRDNDGLGTSGDSQLCSSLVDNTGDWHFELKNVKKQNLDLSFDYSQSGDNLILEAIGPNGGVASQIVDTSEDTPASSMMLEPNTPPVLEWVGEAGYASDGLEPEIGYASTDFIFKIKYIDANGDQPLAGKVYIDKNGDGDYFDQGEANDMTATGSDYVSGVIYTYTTTIPYSQGSGNCSYYFSFSDGLAPATGNITQAINEATAINKPDLFQTLGVSIDKNSWNITPVPIQIPAVEQVTSEEDRIKVTNSGDGLQTFTLMIQDEDNKDEWIHSSTGGSTSLNTYVLSAIFCGASDTVTSNEFNEGQSDDVITDSAQPASDTKFTYSSVSQNGRLIFPLDYRYLYFRLDLPTSVGGTHFDEEHKITVELSCQGE